MTTGLRRDQQRGFEIRAGDVHASSFNSDAYGLVGDLAAIDADDAASAGVSTRVARADHQHAFTCATASALTETATSSEGSAVTMARSDHVHATSAFPFGLVANGRFSSTGNDSARAAGVNTDMTVTVALTANRLYLVILNTQFLFGTVSVVYAEDLDHDGTIVGRFGRQVPATTPAGSTTHYVGTTVAYIPSADDASATFTVQNAAGSGGTITAQPPTSGPRTLTVVDAGPV